jgi:hypothetical protein
VCSYLESSNLTGTISPLIGALVDLTMFMVDYNELTGPIPASLVNCPKISSFCVADNKLNGLVPNLAFSAMGQSFGGCSLLDTNEMGNTFECPWPAGAKAACGVTDDQCTPSPSPPMPTPPPTPQTFKCTGGQCVPGSGLSKADCESICVEHLYQCVSNQCTQASTGLPQAKCEAGCGPSLRGGSASAVALE